MNDVNTSCHYRWGWPYAFSQVDVPRFRDSKEGTVPLLLWLVDTSSLSSPSLPLLVEPRKLGDFTSDWAWVVPRYIKDNTNTAKAWGYCRWHAWRLTSLLSIVCQIYCVVLCFSFLYFMAVLDFFGETKRLSSIWGQIVEKCSKISWCVGLRFCTSTAQICIFVRFRWRGIVQAQVVVVVVVVPLSLVRSCSTATILPAVPVQIVVGVAFSSHTSVAVLYVTLLHARQANKCSQKVEFPFLSLPYMLWRKNAMHACFH